MKKSTYAVIAFTILLATVAFSGAALTSSELPVKSDTVELRPERVNVVPVLN
jgi:hypothetical protein